MQELPQLEAARKWSQLVLPPVSWVLCHLCEGRSVPPRAEPTTCPRWRASHARVTLRAAPPGRSGWPLLVSSVPSLCRGGGHSPVEGHSVQSQHRCTSLLPSAVFWTQSHAVAPPLVWDVSHASSPLRGLRPLDPPCRKPPPMPPLAAGAVEVPSTQCLFCLPGETVEMRRW